MFMFRMMLAIGLIYIFRVNISNKLIITLALWWFFVLSSFVLTGQFKVLALVSYTVRFLEAYFLVSVYGKRIVTEFAKWVSVLSFVSIIGWVWSLVDLGGLFSLMQRYDLSGGFRGLYGDYAHVGIFTVRRSLSSWAFFLPRNHGFCWEPGPYAIIIVLAIYFRYALQRKNIISLESAILLIALATTFSTTGYIAFIIMLMYNYLAKMKRIVYIVPLIAVAYTGVYAFNSLAFMREKVEQTAQYEVSFQNRGGVVKYHGGRLAGLPIVLQDLAKNPFMGRALSQEGYYYGIGTYESTHLNSLYTILSHMGLIGFIFWIYCLFRSSLRFTKDFNHPGKYGLVVLVVIFSFGFNLHIWSIIFTLVMYGYFWNNKHSSTDVVFAER